jgi:hypothetical protein
VTLANGLGRRTRLLGRGSQPSISTIRQRPSTAEAPRLVRCSTRKRDALLAAGVDELHRFEGRVSVAIDPEKLSAVIAALEGGNLHPPD